MTSFIKKWSIALRWWLLFMLINLGTIVMFLTGMIDKISEVDFTKLSFVIYLLCYIFTVRNGILIYKSGKKPPTTEEEVNEYCQKNEVGWFASDMFLTLGMIGTVIGFIFMLSTSFADISTANVVTLKAALSKMSMGMSTALFTTAAGLICGLILKIQLFDFQQYLDKLGTICGCGSKKCD
jgi:hypothetical protein